MRTIAFVAVLLACAVASAAEVYKWKDSDGVVHYGDKPKHDAESLNVAPGSGTGVPSDVEAVRLAREAECQKKKAQYESYKTAPSISEIDNLGKQREYTPAEREQFMAMTEKKVAELCAPPAPAAQSAESPSAPPPATN